MRCRRCVRDSICIRIIKCQRLCTCRSLHDERSWWHRLYLIRRRMWWHGSSAKNCRTHRQWTATGIGIHKKIRIFGHLIWISQSSRHLRVSAEPEPYRLYQRWSWPYPGKPEQHSGHRVYCYSYTDRLQDQTCPDQKDLIRIQQHCHRQRHLFGLSHTWAAPVRWCWKLKAPHSWQLLQHPAKRVQKVISDVRRRPVSSPVSTKDTCSVHGWHRWHG